jgi:hypothetical protein
VANGAPTTIPRPGVEATEKPKPAFATGSGFGVEKRSAPVVESKP